MMDAKHILLTIVLWLLHVHQGLNGTVVTPLDLNYTIHCGTDTMRNWNEARIYCKKLGGRLATVTNDIINKELASLFKGEKCLGEEAGWIGGVFSLESNYWMWTSNQRTFHGKIRDYNSTISGPKCAYIEIGIGEEGSGNSSTIGIFRADKPCNTEMQFLCKNTGDDCKNNTSLCVKTLETLKTWNNSQNECKSAGMEMMTYDKEESDDKEFLWLPNHSHILPGKYWIGLLHAGWTWKDTDSSIIFSKGNLTVSPNKTVGPHGLCVYLTHKQEWYTQSCDQPRNFFCETGYGLSENNINVTPEQYVVKEAHSNTILVAGLISGIALTGTVAVIAVVVLTFTANKKRKIHPHNNTSHYRNKMVTLQQDLKPNSLTTENPYEVIDNENIRYSFTPSPHHSSIPPPLPSLLTLPPSIHIVSQLSRKDSSSLENTSTETLSSNPESELSNTSSENPKEVPPGETLGQKPLLPSGDYIDNLQVVTPSGNFSQNTQATEENSGKQNILSSGDYIDKLKLNSSNGKFGETSMHTSGHSQNKSENGSQDGELDQHMKPTSENSYLELISSNDQTINEIGADSPPEIKTEDTQEETGQINNSLIFQDPDDIIIIDNAIYNT